MGWIVSANYRDRNSPYRWLVRGDDEPASQAKAAKYVEGERVRFEHTPERHQYEAGWGCQVVARCEFVTVLGVEGEERPGQAYRLPQDEPLVGLRFDRHEFLSAGRPVSTVRRLVLAEGVYAAGINETPAPAPPPGVPLPA